MTETSTLFEVVCLLIITLVGLALSVHLVAIGRRLFSFSVLGLLTYLLIYPISGLSHLLRPNAASRGYYDLLAIDDSGSGMRIVVTAVGLVALAIPLLTRRVKPANLEPEPRFVDGFRSRLLLVSLGLVALSVPALMAMSRYAATLDSERIIALSGGMARIGFVSQWITWGIAFGVLFIAGAGIVRRRPALMAALIGAAVFATSAALSWTGGRAIVLMMCAPLGFALWPFLTRKIRVMLVGGLGVAFGLFVAATTVARSAAYSDAQFDLARVVDWELGRYSMIGFASEYVDSHGLLGGATIVQGVLQVPVGLLRFVGATLPFETPVSITQVSGAAILGSPELIYVVPGMSAEWYMNFGLFGVLIAFASLGALLALVDSRLEANSDPVSRLAWSYSGVLLIFCTFSSQSGAIFNYALFTGLPVFVIALWNRSRRSRLKRRALAFAERKPRGYVALS